MNQRIKRIRELFGYAWQLLRQDGARPHAAAGRGLFPPPFPGQKGPVSAQESGAGSPAESSAARCAGHQHSVCRCSIRRENFLRQLLDSLAAQTSPAWAALPGRRLG